MPDLSLSAPARLLRRDRLADAALVGLSLVMVPISIARAALDLPADATLAYWTFRPEPGVYGQAPFTLAAHEYPPIFAQVIAPLTALPWAAFLLLWLGLTTVLLLALVGPRWLGLCLLISPISLAFGSGNLTFVYAVVIVLGASRPWVWAIPILTKVTPGVGLVWFVVRREWRNLAVALGVTGALTAVSLLTVPELWREWATWIVANAGAQGSGNAMALPLWLRVAVAVLLVAWGAKTNRPWVLFAPMWLAQPTTWWSEIVLVLAPFAPTLKRLRPALDDAGRLILRLDEPRGPSAEDRPSGKAREQVREAALEGDRGAPADELPHA